MQATVIIPTLTQPSDELQQSLNRQRFKDYDIVVVKGVSPNGRARNKGAQDAMGEILVFIDDDAVLAHEEVLTNLVTPLLEKQADIVGASRRLPEDSNTFAKAVARQIPLVESPIVDTLTNATPALTRTSWWRSFLKNPLTFLKGEHDQTVWSPITTTCVAMTREVFDALGGFSEDLQWGVDTDFFYRAAQKGFRLALAPQTWVYHPYADNLTQLRKKYFKSGIGMAQEMKVHPKRAIQPALDSPITTAYFIFYRLVGAGVFLFLKPLRAIASVFAMAGYVAGWYDLHTKKFRLRDMPYYLLLLATLLSPLTRLGAFEIGFTLKASEILLILVVIMSMWYMRNRVLYVLRVSTRDPLFLILLGYLMVSAASLTLATNVTRGVLIWAQTALFMFGLVYLPRFFVDTKERLFRIVRVFMLAAMLLALFAVFQFFLDYMGINMGLRDIYVKGRFGYPRVHGTMLEPLYMAHYLLVPLGLAAALYVWNNTIIGWKTSTYLTVVFMCMWAINLGFSRGGWLGLGGLMAVVIALFLFTKKALAIPWKRLVHVLAAVALAFALIPVSIQVGKAYYDHFGRHIEQRYSLTRQQEPASPEPTTDVDHETTQRRVEGSTAFKFWDDRVDRFFDIAVGRREEAWTLAVEYIQISPILGVGIGNFGSQQHTEDDSVAGINFVNNQPLEVLAETGTLGFLFNVLLNVLMIWYLIRLGYMSFLKKDTALMGLSVGLGAAFAGVWVQFMTVSNWNVFHYWLLIGLIYWSFRIFVISERAGDTI